MITGNLLFGCVLGWLWILLTGARILSPLFLAYGAVFLMLPLPLAHGGLKFLCAEFAGFTLGGVMHRIFRAAIRRSTGLSVELEH
jgi:hypothetical protein